MLCRLFFQIYIKIKTDITDIDIAESKIQLKNKSATDPKREKEPTELKRGKSVRSPPSSNVLQQISLHIRELRQNPIRHTLVVFLLSHCNPLIHNVWQPS